jgi:hypothetical protein
MPQRPLTPCPTCEIPQRFGQQRREDDGELIIFMACTSCDYEQIIMSGPRQVVELKLDIDRIEAKIARGVPMHDILRSRQQRLAALESEM